ncbi:hypothetical protein HDZ31DRAFT_61401 [Schizophyllum fasciatum]
MYPVSDLSPRAQSYQPATRDYLCRPAPIGAPGVCPPHQWGAQLPSPVVYTGSPFDEMACRASAMPAMPVHAPAPTRPPPPPISIEIPASSPDHSPSPDASSSASTPKTASRRAREDPNYIPRPPNAYILFRRDYAAKIRKSTESDQRKISEIVTAAWKTTSEEVKEYYKQWSLDLKHEHLAKYPGYKYKPRPRGEIQRRKTNRNNDYETARCKLLAELVAQGYGGESLEEEVQRREPELQAMYPVQEPQAGKKKKKARAVRGVQQEEAGKKAPFARKTPATDDTSTVPQLTAPPPPTCNYMTTPSCVDGYYDWSATISQIGVPPQTPVYDSTRMYTPPADLSPRSQSDQGSLSSPATSAYSSPPTPADSSMVYPMVPYGREPLMIPVPHSVQPSVEQECVYVHTEGSNGYERGDAFEVVQPLNAYERDSTIYCRRELLSADVGNDAAPVDSWSNSYAAGPCENVSCYPYQPSMPTYQDGYGGYPQPYNAA